MAEIRNRISLDGAQQVKADFAAIGQAGQQAFAGIQNSANAAGGAVSRAAGSIGGILQSLVSVGTKAGLAIGGLAIAATAATSAMATSAAQSVTAISTAAEALGLTVEQFQRIQNAALSAGVSTEKFGAGVGTLRKAYDQAVSSAREFQNATVVTENTYDQLGVTVRSFSGEQDKATGQNAAAVELFRRLGVTLVDAQGRAKDFGLVLTQVRDAFSRLSPSQQTALQGSVKFGETIRQLGPFLKAGRQDISDYNDAWDKSSRGITKSEEEVALALTAAQADLSDALSATSNKVGLLFAPGKTRTAEFFTEILDGTRNATIEFVKMAQASARAFVIENAPGFLSFFQRVGQTIASFTEKAAPAFAAILDTTKRLANEGFQTLAEQLTRLSGISFTADFLKAATAIAALTGSFSSLSLISTPVVAVLTTVGGLLIGLGPISVIAGLAVVAFWDDFKTAAVSAYDAVLGQSDTFKKAFEALKFGDFQGGFDLLRKAGTDAFNALLAQAPGLQRQFTNLQNAVIGIGANIRAVFQTVRGVLTGVAITINQVFGTNLTASTIAFYIAVAQLTGVLGPASNGLLALTNVMRVLGLQGTLVAIAILAVVRALPALEQFASRISKAFGDIFSGSVVTGIRELGEAFSKLFSGLQEQTFLTIAVLVLAFGAGIKTILGLVGLLGTQFTPAIAAAVGGAETTAAVGGAATALGLGFQRLFIAAATVGVAAGLAAFFKNVSDPAEAKLREAIKNAEDDAKAAKQALEKDAGTKGSPTDFTARTNEAQDALAGPGKPAEDGLAKSIEASNQLGVALSAVAQAGVKAVDAVKTLGTVAKDAVVSTGAAVGKPLEDGLARSQEAGQKAATALQRIGEAGRTAAASLVATGQAAKEAADDTDDDADSADNAAEATDKWAVTVHNFGANGKKSIQDFGDGVKDAAKATEDAAGTLPRVFDQRTIRDFGNSLDDTRKKTDATADSTKSLTEVLQKAFDTFLKTGDAAGKAADKAAGGFKRITLPQSAGDGSGGSDLAAQGGGAGESSTLGAAEQQAQPLSSTVDDLIGKVSGGLTAAFASAAGSLTAGLVQAGASIDGLIAKAQQLANTLAAGQGGPSGGDTASAGPVGGFAAGGAVAGPGGPTSDSIPARLSVGEHVIRAAAVAYYGGHRLFHALNRMAIPAGKAVSALANGLPGLPAMIGARLSMPLGIPAFAEGGPVLPTAAAAPAAPTALHPVTFQLPGGHTIEASMTEHQFDTAMRGWLVRKGMRLA